MRHLRPLHMLIIPALGALFASTPVLADPPHHAGKHAKHKHKHNGPPAHAGGPGYRAAPPPGWQKKMWHRGERLPIVEIGDGYWIDDYTHYHLRQPTRGQRWVRQADDRYLLVEVATGLIIDALSR